MDGGGAPPGSASARRSCCGRPQHSLARWPRTISLFCRPSAARSAEPRSANVTNAQCRVSSTCAAATGALSNACLNYSLLHPAADRRVEHQMLLHCVNSRIKCEHLEQCQGRNQTGGAELTATFSLLHSLMLQTSHWHPHGTQGAVLITAPACRSDGAAPEWSVSRQRGRTGRAGRPPPRPAPVRPRTCPQQRRGVWLAHYGLSI